MLARSRTLVCSLLFVSCTASKLPIARCGAVGTTYIRADHHMTDVPVVEHAFNVDPVASKLKAGERPACGGLVLVVGWSWGSDSSTCYGRLAADMAALDPDSLHVYDAQHLHCTVATLSRCGVINGLRSSSRNIFKYLIHT